MDIINRDNGTYIDPIASYNTAVTTIASAPSRGWNFDYCNVPGLYIINSGTTQLNQTQSDLGWKVYNWSSKSDGKDRDDKGCQYMIELVTEEPEEIVPESYINFSFTRGTTLENTFVKINDEQGNSVSGVTARLVANGAASWLTTNNAASDSILCLNINSNTTTATSPITYFLEIDGLDKNWSFNNIVFRSVALNSAGNWQGSTETRHCNFVCSYGYEKENLTELATKTDVSIMYAGGVPKDISFETDGISPLNGKLIVKLVLYKGTDNKGCFYGLTGVVLKGSLKESTTAVEEVDVHVVQPTAIYDTTGRRVENMSKGIYIVNGVKTIVR